MRPHPRRVARGHTLFPLILPRWRLIEADPPVRQVRSSPVLCALLYCMRYAFESVWRCLSTADAPRAPQLSPPQWQILHPEHATACDRAVAHAAAADAAPRAPPGSNGGHGGGANGDGAAASESRRFIRALEHLSAYHDVPLRAYVRAQLERALAQARDLAEMAQRDERRSRSPARAVAAIDRSLDSLMAT